MTRRVPLAELDEQRERVVGDGAFVAREPLREAGAPVAWVDRGEGEEAPEAVERPPARCEQVGHQMFDAAGEQAGDVLGVLQDGAHLLGEPFDVAVGRALGAELLELVDVEHQPLAVGGRDALAQAQGVAEVPAGVAVGEAGPERDLDDIAQLAPHASGHRGGGGRGESAPGALGTGEELADARAVGQHAEGQCLGDLGERREREEVERHRVPAATAEPLDRGLAHARLAGAARAGDDAVQMLLELVREVADRGAAPDEIGRGEGGVGREQLTAARSRHVAP